MLYQQGTQRIEIIVRKDSGTGQDGAKETDTENVSSSSTQNEISSNGGLTARERRIAKNMTMQALSATKNTSTSILNYIISGMGQRNGDETLQNQIERNVEIVQDITGTAYSVAMGAFAGSWAGPIGVVVGGLTAALSSATSIGTKYARRERDYSYNIFKENNAIEYQRAIAGINLTNGRLR